MSDGFAMRVFLTEITERDMDLDFTQEDRWVSDAVSRVDERSEDSFVPRPGPRTARGHLSLRKVDDVVVISGDVDTSIQLVCSRCATPFQMPAHPAFSALYCTDPEMAGIAHLAREGSGRSSRGDDRGDVLKPRGQNKGFQRHAHDSSLDATYGPNAGKGASGDLDLDITYLSQEYIDLGEVLSEQLQLQVPFQPLCKEDCKGICANCGADLNAGRCACDKIVKTSPFSVLRDFKSTPPAAALPPRPDSDLTRRRK